MAQLPSSKKILTYGEYRQKVLAKYKANPDDPDPEVQKLKKELENFKARFAPSQQQLEKMAEEIRTVTKSFQPIASQIILATDF